ncbi:MAG: hypothetical protein OEX18_13960 [Candidatus Krumholzibacteria bacterium]|nr:hypothetical protein [Candidatus Krumholzibacteria bacterium]MDH5270868.1 hypothetical protein [Candidatus Krumholzibacteria bacterium]
MKRFSGLALLLVALLAVGCGGSDSPAGPGGGGGPIGGGGNSFTATVDGQPFKADVGTIQVTGNTPATRQGTLAISGFQTSTGVGLTLIISFFIGPATQPLGVNTGTNPGGTGSVLMAPDIWMTPLNGHAGFVTVTARTDKRIAGTFNFTSDGILPGIVPASRVVTNGKFDITIDTGLPPLPSGVGSTAIANIGGQPWNAATIVGLHPGAGVFSVNANNTEYSVTLVTSTLVSAGNTYGIPSQMGMTITHVGTTDSWYGGVGADVGSVTISTFDANRLVASFSGTFQPIGTAVGTLTVTGGAINAYLE